MMKMRVWAGIRISAEETALVEVETVETASTVEDKMRLEVTTRIRMAGGRDVKVRFRVNGCEAS